ncbi:hypothetical protein FGB62_128g110 [Gracilaria domingensis]|nr:hypothetical protein FGB62_128g110 [Gracilaria domingensis]
MKVQFVALGEGANAENAGSSAFVDDEELLSVTVPRVVTVEKDAAPDDQQETGGGSFDDELPTALPESEEHGLVRGDRYDGPLNPSWCGVIHLPKGHRSELLSVSNLRDVHHLVFWHAARAEHRLRAETFGMQYPRTRPTGVDDEEVLWVAAKEHDEFGQMFFARMQAELRQNGYCVLDGFATDNGVPKWEELEEVREFGDVSGKLVDFFENEYGAMPDIRKGEEQKSFVQIIINDDEGWKDGSDGPFEGRVMSTRWGTVEKPEDNEELRWVVRSRALLDVRMGTIAAALGLWENEREAVKMYTPKTGGRFLGTTRKCKRQTLHTDFSGLVTKETMNTGNPGYFVMASGKEGFPLWVSAGSHQLVGMNNQQLRVMSEVYPAKKIIIPPYSVFVGRGDVTHARASGKDKVDRPESMDLLVGYHMYMVPEGYALPDAVHRVRDFRPTFVNGDEEEEAEDELLSDKEGGTVDMDEDQVVVEIGVEADAGRTEVLESSSDDDLPIMRLRAPRSG